MVLTEAELFDAISAKGDVIKQMKTDKVSKKDLQPHVDELLSLKGQYKDLTGKVYSAEDGPKKPPKDSQKAKAVAKTEVASEAPSKATVKGAKQPTWYPQQQMPSMLDYWQTYYPLKIYNSLTRSKVPFVPIEGKRVLWYMCGPTVYEKSHLGHARTYVCSDIVRRIMSDYFGYDILLCMNVTDVDDKIILRAMENGWQAAHPGKELPATKPEMQKVVTEWAASQDPADNVKRTLSVSNTFEHEFFDSMKRLGLRRPDIITRVSEYIPEVCDFIQQIIANGFAYESNGSVYFDVTKFQNSGAAYGKLVPENVGSAELLEEGEGSLGASLGQVQSALLAVGYPLIERKCSMMKADKRSPSDFALWKASKPGEPRWSSPWGEGRPGWHIECSAMASSALKDFANGVIDIHTGGIDLRFPHHDNEIAQTEAHFGFKQWVNYFIHTGHLNIQGLKMSKSLKNFITIQEALTINTARQIRFLFLLHKYNQPMDYSQNTMDRAVSVLRFFTEYFANVKARLRELPADAPEKYGPQELELGKFLVETKDRVRAALCDDFDTVTAINELSELVRQNNRYLASGGLVVSALLRSNAEYITEIFRVFGLTPRGTDIGFPVETESGQSGVNREEVLAPVLDILTKFRENIRNAARQGDISALMNLCDSIRDDELVNVGVRLEDKGDEGAVWKLEDPKVLLLEREQKLEEKKRKEELKRQKDEEKLRKEAEERDLAKVKPEDLFKRQTELYSKFDAEGIPTHDAAGEALSKGQTKKLKKEQEKHAKLYQKYN